MTGIRVGTDTNIAIATHLRIDEILAGATLALLMSGRLGVSSQWLGRISPWLAVAVLILICNPHVGPLQYLRPYAGALAVATTLARPEHPFARRLDNRVLKYLAMVSYAMYVIHGPLRTGWFAGEGLVDRYLLKRPMTFVLTFALAHLSTFHWEARWIALGRRLTRRRSRTDPWPADSRTDETRGTIASTPAAPAGILGSEQA